ncbi:PadR family transcriptional regulator [Alterisphingorhabdus coralli]|uniref:PadR family transcriptional regulator n=1 Tax=Alterisphingorhabdus coralli TaxID=3071408 RepID=A0AA97I273_9SPHN|nr:PadR family transcriptional regulator [Parasphingorhabdus sp. SCSIO 66989]WOE76080.1 PadR family transcriptional regulator [Parasphingorhabdus sp. SCSIO 66989]
MTKRYTYGFDPDEFAEEMAAIPEAIMAAFGGRWGGTGRRARKRQQWSGGWDNGASGNRGRRKRRMFDSGELRLVLLKLIADEPRHGYDLIRAIEDMTEGSYAPSPGVIYPTLNLLEDSGLIAQEEAEGSRKIFTITDDGRAEIEKNEDSIAGLMDRLDSTGESKRARSRKAGAPVGRAIGNLMSALGNRVARSDMDDDMRHSIAEILDEAAQKIERL